MPSPTQPASFHGGYNIYDTEPIIYSPTHIMPTARGHGKTHSTPPPGPHLEAAPTDTKADTDMADAAQFTSETPQSSPQTRSARRRAQRQRQRHRKRERRVQELQSEDAAGEASTEPEPPASSSSPASSHPHGIGSAATTTVAPYISSFSPSGIPLLAHGIANPAGMNPEVWNVFAGGLNPGEPARIGNEVFELMMAEGKVEEEPELEPEPEPKRKKNRRRGGRGGRRGGRGGGQGGTGKKAVWDNNKHWV
ncbi:hypothetical protein E8E13_010621 [Curvularia kusanoi]|uniref:Uncharacterized protein n=1 Tax=Curvularia kusanoi TaxID=90978 RepID=A0A9P4TJ13_CURKU|nr:hypothetical protein E8E13_010621 [Curvularia kusanoi]